MDQTYAAGDIALVGSGEYTPAMRATDLMLLAGLGEAPPVALIPAASGLEPGQPERWNGMGAAHFAGLGARPTPVALTGRADAEDESVVAALRDQRLYYFSGGQPDHLLETLAGTPAWEVIRAAHAAGATLAGCSAGAMVLGGAMLSVRALRSGQPPSWRPGIGAVPEVGVLPHFDRSRAWMSPELLERVRAAAPPGITVVGVDEDTALVRLGGAWRVSGRQTVTVFHAGGAAVYREGEAVPLR
jgi:cyanophycinase